MEKNWNTTENYTKSAIDEAINKILENKFKFQLTSIELLKMLQQDEDCNHLASWYATISQAIFNGDRVDYPEKEEFLILHKSLLDVYNETTKTNNK